MQNIYEMVKGHLHFRKFVLDDIVCIEYSCPLDEQELGIYSQTDYLIHVLSGQKTWQTIEGKWQVSAGETFFIKKGATIVQQYFDDEFCMLGFFLPDDLIRSSLSGIATIDKPVSSSPNAHRFTAGRLIQKTYLNGFVHSLYPYFQDSSERLPDAMLRLKLKELLINIYYHCGNTDLVSYLRGVVLTKEPSLTHIMETNFAYNLRLSEYAKMCHRSLSTFKRDFFNHYNMTPGKWLQKKRLDYAVSLLVSGDSNVTSVAFDAGFIDVSHFSRAFKKEYGVSPRAYIKSVSA